MGLVLAIYYYRKKKNVLGIFLTFILTLSLVNAIAEGLGYATNIFYIEPLLTFLTVLIVIIVLIILNRRLSEQMVEATGELKASEKKYQMLVDNITDVIYEIDLEKGLSSTMRISIVSFSNFSESWRDCMTFSIFMLF